MADLPWASAVQASASIASGVEHPQDEVKEAMIAQFALWPPLGHGEVREEKCRELRCGELDRHRRRCRLWCHGAHHAMASWEEW